MSLDFYLEPDNEGNAYLPVVEVRDHVLCAPSLRKGYLRGDSRVLRSNSTAHYLPSNGLKGGLDVCGGGAWSKIAP